MSYNKKRGISAMLAILTIAFFAGCTQKQSNGGGGASSSAPIATTAVESLNESEMFTSSDKEVGYDEGTAISIVLSGESIKCDSDAVKISGSTATITDEGTYILSGSLTNGQLVVEAEKTDKLRLVLNDADINCDTSAAIYIKQADKVFITLAEGTENALSNTSEFVAVDENSVDAVIFSKDDLTLNGGGSLTINAAYGHGIVSKDDLAVTSGVYKITAENHSLSANDSVRIADGDFTLSSRKDGIQAENAEDTSLGFVYISGGSFEITSGGDGISASGAMQIESGAFRINSGGGSQNATVKQEESFSTGGRNQQAVSAVTDTTGDSSVTDSTDTTVSTKGIKSTGNLVLDGGEFSVDSADDSLHANAKLIINGGSFILSSGDDGVHADDNVTISDGTVTVTKSYEGIEGQSIDIAGGVISVTSSDDGLNAAGGNDQSGIGGMSGMGRDSFAADSDCYIKIAGGKLNIDASGDGIDSNGGLSVSGGETYLSGPTNSGNGALDYNGEAQISGGIFVAVSASGMVQNFGASSTQGAILVNLSPTEAKTELVLKDSGGNTLVSYTPNKSYSSVVISCPQIKQGESYTLEAGSQSTAIEMTSLIYGSGGGMGGMGGGHGGGMRGEPPTDGTGGEPPSGNIEKNPPLQ